MKGNRMIEKFVSDQLSQWPLAASSYRALKAAETRELEVGGLTVRLQHNPARIRSTAAKVDAASLKARKCFLCAANRPAEQRSLRFEGRKGRVYDILLNPYPIFPSHLVIALRQHADQSIWSRYVDMLDLAHHYTDHTIFYNGPRCGASAPDHLHFQACPRHLLPLEREIDSQLDTLSLGMDTPKLRFLGSVKEAQAYHYGGFTRGIFVLRARTSKSMAKLFYRLLDCAPVPEGEKEPMFNLFTWYQPLEDGGQRPAGNTHGLAPFEYRAIVMFRGSHRSHHFHSDGPDHLTISPGCADMAGLLIVPDPVDYAKLDSALIGEVLSEVSASEEMERGIIWRMTRTQTELQVGIMSGSEIEFEIVSDGAGPQKVSYRDGKIDYNGTLYDELLFDSATSSTMFAEPAFILHGVTIGVDFHWQRTQTQKFAGSLKFIADGGKVVAVNLIGVEDYLLSVISSEMKASASLEFLKAHAVISRSWVMSQIRNRRSSGGVAQPPARESQAGTRGGEVDVVKWFDHEDHTRFDVCADDHCQRYQGLTKAVGDNVRRAIDQTWGEVITFGGEICDARFSKCCGGVMEEFSTCWEDRDMPYLQALPDTPDHDPDREAFCNTADEDILRQVLNDYDLETRDFYRWTARYPRAVLADLITRRSGYDIGHLDSLQPLERGRSGRISRMRIAGSNLTVNVGKELMIRRWLSESHLKSSAFDVRTEGDDVVLEGKGWGHGVGLCQIGAAVMACRGYSYDSILLHYYPGTAIEKR